MSWEEVDSGHCGKWVLGENIRLTLHRYAESGLEWSDPYELVLHMNGEEATIFSTSSEYAAVRAASRFRRLVEERYTGLTRAISK